MTVSYQLRRSDNSHGPSIHLIPYTFHSDGALSGLGSVAKNPALQAEAVWSFSGLAGFLSNCSEFRLTEPSSSRMEGWPVKIKIIKNNNGTGDFHTSWLSAQRLHRK